MPKNVFLFQMSGLYDGNMAVPLRFSYTSTSKKSGAQKKSHLRVPFSLLNILPLGCELRHARLFTKNEHHWGGHISVILILWVSLINGFAHTIPRIFNLIH